MPTTREQILGTAGHIDHGKTALVRALTGVDTDRLPDEKRRGITIDLGFAALDLGAVRLGLVDVPGHERFIRNMLAGATGFDLALLVVAADDSVMPQTREHLEILRLLGLRRGVVALSKCDLVDPDWLAMVEEDVRGLVAGTFLEGAPIVRTSAVTGLGIDALRSALAASLPDADEAEAYPFRLAIDRAFTVSGHGTVVTGTVAGGTAAVGDELALMPEGRPVRVRSLQHHGESADRVGRGARAAINLGGVHHEEIRRGQVLAEPGSLVASTILSATVRVSDDASRPLRHRARYRLHLGTAEVTATLALFDGPELRPGDEARGQLLTAEPVVAVYGQPFVLREESPPRTVGGGRVLQPVARRIRRRDRHERERLARLASPDPIERAAAALGSYRLTPWTDRDLGRDAGLPPAEAARIVAEDEARGLLVRLPVGPRRTVRVERRYLDELEDRAVRAVGRLHARNPRLSGVRRSSVLGELADLESDSLVAALIDRLAADGRLVATDRTVALADYRPQLTQAERKLKEEAAAEIAAGGFAPPLVSELADRAGPRASVVPELLGLLVEEDRLVEVAERSLYLDAGADQELRRRVADRLADGSTITMSELRDLIGVTRKHAVPIGEYLDRVGLTVRDGDLRRLGPSAAEGAGA